MSGALAGLADAQTVDIAAAFTEVPKHPRGRLLEVSPGVFLGTSATGGPFFGDQSVRSNGHGTIFVLYRKEGQQWSTVTLHAFNGQDGSEPESLIPGRDGNFYGTTRLGGDDDRGTVFKLSPGGELTRLHSFSQSDGYWPAGPLVQTADGTLWGITQNGGAAIGGGSGTIFKITATGTFDKVHAFIDTAEGGGPSSLILAADGTFYGLAGVAFHLTPSGTYTVLSRLDGLFSVRDLLQATDGDFYGVANGSAGAAGAVFRVTKTGETTILHEFTNEDGARPFSLMQASDGSFYGTTGKDVTTTSGVDDVDHLNTAFRIESSGAFATIAEFDAALGLGPSGLIEASDGLLYGTTQFGGSATISAPEYFLAGFGTAFRLPTTGPATLLTEFISPLPVQPTGMLLEVSGALYGTSCRGGLYGFGTVYRATAATVTTLHSFRFFDGACPVAGLRLGPDGALYGSTLFGTTVRGNDAGNFGVLFRITTAGDFTVLHTFDGTRLLPKESSDGSHPWGRIVFAPDGSLYGTAGGLQSSDGTIFRVSSDGSYQIVHDFTFDPHSPGFHPYAGLVLGTDGFLYGAGFDQAGLFRSTTDGDVTILHVFDRPHERRLNISTIALTQGTDSRLYGVSPSGGTFGGGVVFRWTLPSAVDVIHEFGGGDGYNPIGELIERAGVFYGTSFGTVDGSRGFGTVFRLTPDGAITTLHRFGWYDGANPVSGLLHASDGALYGTTATGGPGGGGVVYRIRVP